VKATKEDIALSGEQNSLEKRFGDHKTSGGIHSKADVRRKWFQSRKQQECARCWKLAIVSEYKQQVKGIA